MCKSAPNQDPARDWSSHIDSNPIISVLVGSLSAPIRTLLFSGFSTSNQGGNPLTQQQLTEVIGVTYQQAHKYERGINRVSAGRLFEIARALSTPITYFYEDIGEEGPRQITPHQRMQLEIARNFAEIRNEKHQEAVSQLARALASR